MRENTLAAQTLSGPERPGDAPPAHRYYPDEGFGNMYRRAMLNDFFTDLVHRTHIRKVAEVPLESYGIVGAGCLILTQLGADLTLISDDQNLLDRAQALMRFNSVSRVNYLHSPLRSIPVADDTFDFTWNFDELLPMSDREAFLREQCRISKAAMVVIPSANNYGQVMHHIYHKLTGTTCMHADPREWMRHKPVREAFQRNGMTVVAEGIIDVPWWPSFPELGNIVRGWLGRPPVQIDTQGIPEANPKVVPPADVPAMRRKIVRNGFVERGRWPRLIKLFFAHNFYVIGCKPQSRQALGL